jgi:hypothetical protein
VSDLLERIHEEIRERLAASRAAALEYERLEAALHALSGSGTEAAAAVTSRRGRRRSGASTSASAEASDERPARAEEIAAGSAPPNERTAEASRGQAAAAAGRRRSSSGKRGARARSGPTPRAAASQRAPRGANRAAVLRVVAERPGITSSEIAGATGMQRPTLSTLLHRLTTRGEVARRELPAGTTGYVLAGSAPAGDAPLTPEPPQDRAEATASAAEPQQSGIDAKADGAQSSEGEPNRSDAAAVPARAQTNPAATGASPSE